MGRSAKASATPMCAARFRADRVQYNMTANDENLSARRPPHLPLRIVLLLFSFTEFINAVFDLPRLQESAVASTPALRFVDAVAATRIVLAPLITAAAFVFTIAGKIPRAVVAFAALIFVKAAASLAWFATGLFTVPSGLDAAYWVLLRYVYPLMAITALVLLKRGGRLNVAGALVLLPTGIAWLYWIMLFVAIVTDPD
jgi:hypothetical protein